jgi:hypothetical protein
MDKALPGIRIIDMTLFPAAPARTLARRWPIRISGRAR